MGATVAFFVRTFSERGTERALYDYADCNETVLANQSLIVCFSETRQRASGFPLDRQSRSKFAKRFPIHEIDEIESIDKLIAEHQLTHFYTLSHGVQRDIYNFEHPCWRNCQTIYHAVFGPFTPQGADRECVISPWLNHQFAQSLPVVPHIVRPIPEAPSLRQQLGIPENALVIGRHGGVTTFDIDYVWQAIHNSLERRKDLYFLLLNTRPAIQHERILHLPQTTDDTSLHAFIHSCDAMLHARREGETFGLAVAEFSAANKPVITCGTVPYREHLRILGERAMIYNTTDELTNILTTIDVRKNTRLDWNAYGAFTPEAVMALFKQCCLD